MKFEGSFEEGRRLRMANHLEQTVLKSDTNQRNIPSRTDCKKIEFEAGFDIVELKDCVVR